MLDHIKNIEKLLADTKIINSVLISKSFNINCLKINTDKNKRYIVKFYDKKQHGFNAIEAEALNLQYLNRKKIKKFPKIIKSNKMYLIIEYIENDKDLPKKSNHDLLKVITDIHQSTNKYYGFEFNTQIGGDEQINSKTNNWINFFKENRLINIFEKINKSNPMPSPINFRIEKLINYIENILPATPIPRLLHGDLWEGNILFNKSKVNGLIDPGSFFGHNEIELAYLRWFNPKFIDSDFINKYNDYIEINSNYIDYEPVYQIYYSLMNVYLWDRSYIKNTEELLNKLKI
tara:strand:+ start:1191 stop:2060 length:870 start_codon:yes stop_codon:yes gene_type:complete